MSTSPRSNPGFGDLFLFIYQVRPRLAAHDDPIERRFCTVLVEADQFSRAEEISINRVNQRGWRILRTDTATRLEPHQISGHAESAAHLDELRRVGTALWVS
jgi:hypothetical protein